MPVDERLLRLGWGIAVLATVVVLTLIQAPTAVIMAVLVALPASPGSGPEHPRRAARPPAGRETRAGPRGRRR